MLSIKIGDSFIPTDPTISLPLVLRSPLFDNDQGKTPGSFVFNVSLPATPELRKEFKYAHRASRLGRATAQLPFVIRFGSLYYTGSCYLKEANATSYEVLFTIRNGDFAAEIGSDTLKSLDLGGENIMTGLLAWATRNTDVVIRENRAAAPFVMLIPIFDHIKLDNNSTMSSFGNTFVAPVAGAYKKRIIITTERGEVQNVNLEVKKNGVLFGHYPLIVGMAILDYTYTLLAHDILTFAVYAESVTNRDRTAELLEITILAESCLTLVNGSPFEGIELTSQDTSAFALFPMENTNLFDNFPKDEFQIDNVNISQVYSESFYIQNYWKEGCFPYLLSEIKNGEHVVAMNVFTPFVYIKFILDRIALKYKYELKDCPFSTDPNYFNAVLFNAFAENTYQNDDASMIGVKPTFNLSDHVPDVLISTFLNAICKLTGTRIDVDTEFRTITFVHLRAVIESQASDPFPGIITSPMIVTVEDEFKGYKLTFKADGDKYIKQRIVERDPKHVYKGSVPALNYLPPTGNQVNDQYLTLLSNEFYVWKYSTELYHLAWVYHSKNFFLSLTHGTEPFLTISADIGPVIDHRVQDETASAPEFRIMILPITWQAGNFEGYPDMSEDYGLQVLFYKGLHPDSYGNTYPLAVSASVDFTGGNFDNINLCLDGLAPNVYTEKLKQWLDWLVYESKPVKFTAILTPAQLRKMRYQKKYRILGNNYLIKEIRLNMTDAYLSEAEIDAYSC
ncbi:MAG: hypothetical protein WCR72_08310 [Bacteroidota bacterium]